MTDVTIKIKQFINKQNPRHIYALLGTIIFLHFLLNHNRILIESDVNKIRSGRIELFIIFIFILQIILINKYIQRILKFGVIIVYFKYLYYYFELLTTKTIYYTYKVDYYLILLLFFGISTVISYIFYTIIENISSLKN